MIFWQPIQPGRNCSNRAASEQAIRPMHGRKLSSETSTCVDAPRSESITAPRSRTMEAGGTDTGNWKRIKRKQGQSSSRIAARDLSSVAVQLEPFGTHPPGNAIDATRDVRLQLGCVGRRARAAELTVVGVLMRRHVVGSATFPPNQQCR